MPSRKYDVGNAQTVRSIKKNQGRSISEMRRQALLLFKRQWLLLKEASNFKQITTQLQKFWSLSESSALLRSCHSPPQDNFSTSRASGCIGSEVACGHCQRHCQRLCCHTTGTAGGGSCAPAPTFPENPKQSLSSVVPKSCGDISLFWDPEDCQPECNKPQPISLKAIWQVGPRLSLCPCCHSPR